jgi:hypothetical protein
MPEIRPPENPETVKMTAAIQLMSFELMSNFNSTITPQNWTRVHDYDRAFTNGAGYNDPRGPRVNYILGKDIGADLPAYTKAGMICGGTFITGEAQGNYLVCRAGVDGIDADSLPSLVKIITRHWYTHAVSMEDPPEIISNFPQGNGGKVVMPFIFRGVIKYPLAWFQRWQANVLPHPLAVYLPLVDVPTEAP